MAGARYCQVVVSASRKLKHEGAHVRKGFVLNRDSCFDLSKVCFFLFIFFKSDVTNHKQSENSKGACRVQTNVNEKIFAQL